LLILTAANGTVAATAQMRVPPAASQDVLRSSTDRAALERAASALARNGDETSLGRLQQLLTDATFLARLDDIAAAETRHVAAVIAALGERPNPRVVALCELLAEHPVFVSLIDRKGPVLDVLASAAPMTDKTAAIFERSNDDGYFSSNALLLAANGSPAALRVFESMMGDTTQPAANRVESLHRGLVPRRHQVAILRMASRILAKTRERAIALGTVESIFDYKQEWFGIESRMIKPEGWNNVSTDVRQAALVVADQALARRDLTAALRALVTEQRRTLADGPPRARRSETT
jgi:hypothetical protein